MFRVRPHEVKTASWWNGQRDEIDMAPPYQRNGNLWSEENKSLLIDTMLNNFDMPKLYVADFTVGNTKLNKKKKQYAIIDGRQRLESIFEFFAGKFPLSEDFIWVENPRLKLGGLTYKDLQKSYPKVAETFDNFNLTVMSVYTDDEAKINELFVRLNSSTPLTGSEVRNAMKGRVPELVRKIANHSFFTNRIGFSTKRGQDKNTAAKLLLIEFNGKFVDTKKYKLDAFVIEAVKAETDDITGAEVRVEATLDAMSEVFNAKDKLLKSEGKIPLYYWLVRNVEEEGRAKIREFLVDFEKLLYEAQQAIKELQSDGFTVIDDELNKYLLWNRSTNDETSLKGRYAILLRRFELFVAPQGKK